MDEAVDGLTEISQWATGFSATTNNVAWYIIAAILTVALIPVVYAVASKSNNAKSYVVRSLDVRTIIYTKIKIFETIRFNS